LPRLDKLGSIQIRVQNRRTGESKSFTVYDTDVEEALEIVTRAFGQKTQKTKPIL